MVGLVGRVARMVGMVRLVVVTGYLLVVGLAVVVPQVCTLLGKSQATIAALNQRPLGQYMCTTGVAPEQM